jgi:hypothetical protein
MSLRIDQNNLIKPTDKLPIELKLIEPRLDSDRGLDLRWLRVEQICYDQKTDIKERLESFFVSAWDQAFTLYTLLCGDAKGVEIYYGVSKSGESHLDAIDYRSDLLKKSLEGRLPGSQISEVNYKAGQRLLCDLAESRRLSLMIGLPTTLPQKEENTEKKSDALYQLTRTMMGESYWILNICEPTQPRKVAALKKDLTARYAILKKSAEQDKSIQKGTQTSQQSTKGSNASSGSSSKTQGTSDTHTEVKGKQDSETTQYKEVDRNLQNELELIDELALPRLDEAESFGMYQVTTWLGASDRAAMTRLNKTCHGLFQRDAQKGRVRPLRIYCFDEPAELEKARGFLKARSAPRAEHQSRPLELQLMSMIGTAAEVQLATLLTPRELNLIGGVPFQEVPGLAYQESVSFGLNFPMIEEPAINLGKLIDRSLEFKTDSKIARSSLNRHTFIAGVTGAGKTTTCKRLLTQAQLPFLVIEPTKTEYRDPLLDPEENTQKLLIFTVSDEQGAPLRLNPLALQKGESICQRVDQLKASFEAAYEMEAAIPQIIEAALYLTYEWYGWDLTTNLNRHCTDPFSVGGLFFPTLSDLSIAVEEVVKNQGFDQRLQNDYVGSLKARLSGLAVGPKGLMMNTRGSISMADLLDRKVVIELDALKAPSDKALLMGIFLGKWASALKERWSQDNDYQHLTLLEEAHRLLTRLPEGISTSRAQAVEVFTDLIAEVRKYGEGMIIADQIPSKLAAEVLKNTTTKIIHTLYARDDREVVGDTMGLDEEQRNWISKLSRGEAVVIGEDWSKAACVKVANQKQGEFKPNELKELFKYTRTEFQSAYFPEIELVQDHESQVNLFDVDQYQVLATQIESLWPSIKRLVTAKEFTEYTHSKYTELSSKLTSYPDPHQAKLLAARLLLSEAKWGKLGTNKNTELSKGNYQSWLNEISKLLESFSDLVKFNHQLKHAHQTVRSFFNALKE